MKTMLALTVFLLSQPVFASEITDPVVEWNCEAEEQEVVLPTVATDNPDFSLTVSPDPE